jgi:two-component system chemotaxis response regulator CheB
MPSTIKVLVVDDSALIRQMLMRALSVDPRIDVVGTAKTGVEAIEKALTLGPDVITLDVEMPEMTGIEALPHIIRTTSARVVMLSNLDDPDTTYSALSLGAIDFIAKPDLGFATSLSELSDLLLKKIRTAYRINPDRRITERGLPSEPTHEPSPVGQQPIVQRGPAGVRMLRKVVAFAASTGGPPALEAVFSGLSADLPSAYMVVQHLPAGFTASLAKRIGKVTDILVVEGAQGMPIEAGTAYIAPHGTHMIVEGKKRPRLGLLEGPSIHGVKPAADPLMESVASVFGIRSVGVILTGMGSDGAIGLRDIRKSGGETIVQDEATSVVWGMPGAASRMGAADRTVPLPRIAAEVRRSVREGVV